MIEESKKFSLADIIETELAIYRQIEEAEGEISEEMDLALEMVQIDRADKLDACKYILDQFDQRSEFLKKKEEEFRASRKKCEALQDRLKKRIKEGMVALGLTEAMGNLYRFRLSVSKAPKITIDETILPVDYCKVVQRYVPDRDKIEQDLELGLEITGAKFEPIMTLRSYINSGSTSKKKEKEAVS